MLRYLLSIPIIFACLMTLFQIVNGNWLNVLLWLFVVSAFLLILVPVIKKDANDKTVPVVQIFSLFFILPIIASFVAFFDIRKLAIGDGAVVLYSFLTGVGILAIIIILKGN